MNKYLEGAVPYPEDAIQTYVEKGWWLDLTFGDILDGTVAQHPDKIGVIDDRIGLTFTRIKHQVDRLAIALLDLGIQQYDRILFQLPNRHEFVIAFYAAHRIGAVPVLSVARQEYQEINYFCEVAEPAAWVVAARDGNREFRPLIERLRAEHPLLKHVIMPEDGEQLPAGALSMRQLIGSVAIEDYPYNYLARFRPDPNDVAIILTTGGTTGLPKLVPRTHNSYLANIRYTHLGDSDRDVFGLVTPIGHSMAHQGAVGATFMLGGTLVLVGMPRAREILAAVQKWRITSMGVVPTQLEDIIEQPDLNTYDLSSLRSLRTAGAALRPEIADKAREFLDKHGSGFGGAEFGSSEGPCAGARLGSPPAPRGSVGLPKCKGDHWKAVDDEEQLLPPGEEGELVAKGPCVFTGYYKSEAENRTIFTYDGFYKMGDVGKVDEQGNIYITGRKKDIIQRGGEGIIPKQIEDLLHRLPAVEQTAVVGMPDARLGEKACAYVVLKAGARLTFDEMVRALRELGASVLLLPERLEIVDSLPKSGIGKTDKAALRRDIAEKLKSLPGSGA